MNDFYTIQPSITVWLEFPRMPGPVPVDVTWNALRYLDRHAARRFGPDGAVIYAKPRPARQPIAPQPLARLA